MKRILSTLYLLITITNIHSTQPNMENLTHTFGKQLDASTNLELLTNHYESHPERWRTAIDFLSNSNLTSLPLGRTDLSDDVYLTVSEYTTKNAEDAFYESHQQYIDIQYIISGEEYIGITREHIPTKILYDGAKDITFYTFEEGELRLATPQNYFIFFPEDKHRPCIKTKNNSLVKKIVIKIKL